MVTLKKQAPGSSAHRGGSATRSAAAGKPFMETMIQTIGCRYPHPETFAPFLWVDKRMASLPIGKDGRWLLIGEMVDEEDSLLKVPTFLGEMVDGPLRAAGWRFVGQTTADGFRPRQNVWERTPEARIVGRDFAGFGEKS